MPCTLLPVPAFPSAAPQAVKPLVVADLGAIGCLIFRRVTGVCFGSLLPCSLLSFSVYTGAQQAGSAGKGKILLVRADGTQREDVSPVRVAARTQASNFSKWRGCKARGDVPHFSRDAELVRKHRARASRCRRLCAPGHEDGAYQAPQQQCYCSYCAPAWRRKARAPSCLQHRSGSDQDTDTIFSAVKSSARVQPRSPSQPRPH